MQDNRKNGEIRCSPRYCMTDEPEFMPLSVKDGKASGEDEAEPGSLPNITNRYDLRRAGW
jgi:hypothetical protein